MQCPLLDISLITLSQGKYAIVDTADYGQLNGWRWHIRHGHKKHIWYAVRTTVRDGVKKTHWMHRVLGCPPTQTQVDHINHNGLDNRRSNLRICTAIENQRNQRKRNGASRFKGIYWDKQRRQWRAMIGHNGKHICLGRFHDEIAAARAYNMKARELFGEFACLNQV